MVEVTGVNQDLLSRIPEWEREADVFERKAQALRQLVDAVRVLNGDAARLLGADLLPRDDQQKPSALGVNQYTGEAGPRGREAVRRITSERPGLWYVKDIKRINRERGWPSRDDGIETAVCRLARTKEAEKIPGRKGLYRFGAPAPEAAIAVEEGAANELRLVSDFAS